MYPDKRSTLLTLQFGFFHRCYLFHGKDTVTPDLVQASHNVRLRSHAGSGNLSQRSELGKGTASLDDLHGFSVLDPRGHSPEVVSKVSDSCSFHDTTYLSLIRISSRILKNQDCDHRPLQNAPRVPKKMPGLNLETGMERDEDGVVLGFTRLSDSQRLHRQGDATREAGSLVGPMTAADSPSAISVFRLNGIFSSAEKTSSPMSATSSTPPTPKPPPKAPSAVISATTK